MNLGIIETHVFSGKESVCKEFNRIYLSEVKKATEAFKKAEREAITLRRREPVRRVNSYRTAS